MNRWITEWADDSSETAGRLRRRIGFMVLAGMLDQVRDAAGEHRFAVKGGTALEMRYEDKARVSRDVDLLFRGALGDAIAVLTEAVGQTWHGFGGRVGDPTDLTIPWIGTLGQRVDVKLTYLNKPFITLAVEIAASSTSEVELVSSIALDAVGLNPPETVPCLSLRYQIAEKLHACTDPLDGERTNDRVSDIYDLILIADLSPEVIATPETLAACTEVFDQREAHTWPPNLEVPPTWPNLWANVVADNGFYLRDIDNAVERLREIVAAIDSSSPRGAARRIAGGVESE